MKKLFISAIAVMSLSISLAFGGDSYVNARAEDIVSVRVTSAFKGHCDEDFKIWEEKLEKAGKIITHRKPCRSIDDDNESFFGELDYLKY